MKRILCTVAAIVISTAVFIPAEAVAQVGVSIVIGNAPPPPRYEVVPAPRHGYEWAPGYWNVKHKKHKWTKGHWERVRTGHYYQRPQWRQGNDGWRLHRGGWQPGNHHGNRKGHGKKGGHGDLDRDGVPNRYDRDRDGDGVSNRHDRKPDNAHRS